MGFNVGEGGGGGASRPRRPVDTPETMSVVPDTLSTVSKEPGEMRPGATHDCSAHQTTIYSYICSIIDRMRDSMTQRHHQLKLQRVLAGGVA